MFICLAYSLIFFFNNKICYSNMLFFQFLPPEHSNSRVSVIENRYSVPVGNRGQISLLPHTRAIQIWGPMWEVLYFVFANFYCVPLKALTLIFPLVLDSKSRVGRNAYCSPNAYCILRTDSAQLYYCESIVIPLKWYYFRFPSLHSTAKLSPGAEALYIWNNANFSRLRKFKLQLLHNNLFRLCCCFFVIFCLVLF